MILSAIEHKLFLLALAFSQLSLRMASTDQKVFSEDSLLFDVDEESWTGKDAPSRSTILLPDAEQNAHHKSTI